MGISANPANRGQLVETFVNTAYDKVETVHDNLAAILRLSDSFGDLQAGTTFPAAKSDGNALESGDLFFNEATNVLYVYNATTTTWVSITNTSSITESIIVDATMASTGVLTTANPYVENSDSIAVFIQGVYQLSGTDYTETDQNTITFPPNRLNEGELVAIVMGTVLATGDIGGLQYEDKHITTAEQAAGTTGYTISASIRPTRKSNLAVFVQGTKQAQSAFNYDPNTGIVTFAGEYPDEGDEVLFVTGELVSTMDVPDAAYVPYTPAGTGTSSTVAKMLDSISYDVLQDMIDDVADITIGQLIYINERTADNGGGAWWKCVPYVALDVNTYDVVDGDGATKMFELQFGDTVDVKQFGLSLEAARRAIAVVPDYGVLDFGSGIYEYGEYSGGSRTVLALKSNMTIKSDGAYFKLADNCDRENLIFFGLSGVENVSMLGTYYLDGNRANQPPGFLALEDGAIGVFLESSATVQNNNIVIENIIGKDWQSDTLYIGHNTGLAGVIRNVRIGHVYSDNAGRNGISITGWDDVVIESIITENTQGTSPETGVDIEPNSASFLLGHLQIGSILSRNNAGQGVWVLGKSILQLGSVNIDNISAYNNSGIGVFVARTRDISIGKVITRSNSLGGITIGAEVRNIKALIESKDNVGHGINIDNEFGTVQSSDICIAGSRSWNNGQNAVTGDGITMHGGTFGIDNIDISDVSCFDTGGATQRYGIKTNLGTITNLLASAKRLDGNTAGKFLLGTGHFVRQPDLHTSVTYDPPSLIDGASASVDVTVTGALVGDYVDVSFSNNQNGIIFHAYVKTTDTVSVKLVNHSGITLDLASGTLYIRVIKRT